MSKHFPSTITTIGDLSADFIINVAVGLKSAEKAEVVNKKELKSVEIVFMLFTF
jgi:hypothetical protein